MELAFPLLVVGTALIAVPLIAIGVLATVFRLLARFANRYLALGLAAILVAALAYFSISAHLGCSAEPVFYPPEPGSGGAGRAEFSCDGPGAMVVFLLTYVISPVAVVGILMLAAWCVRGVSRKAAATRGVPKA